MGHCGYEVLELLPSLTIYYLSFNMLYVLFVLKNESFTFYLEEIGHVLYLSIILIIMTMWEGLIYIDLR